MLTSDFFLSKIKPKIKDNDFNTLIFNFGKIVNDYLFYHNINDLEPYIQKIKQKDFKFNYKSYQKMTDGINDYILNYDNEHQERKSSPEIKEIKMFETTGFQDMLHLRSSKDIKIVFKSILQNIIDLKEVPQDLDEIKEEIIEFEINQHIRLMIINQKYPKISEVKNDLVINLTLVENQDQNNSNLLEVYHLINYILQ